MPFSQQLKSIQLPYCSPEVVTAVVQLLYRSQEAVKISGGSVGFMQMSCPAAVMQRYTAPPAVVNGSGVSAFQIFKLVPLQNNC